MGDENGSFNPLNYVYPAELCYFGNSAIRVSDQTKAANYYPDGVTDWDNDDKWTNDWVKDSHVTNTTRSVAMKDNINYGTALLETKVKFGAATLQDNYGALDKRWNNKPEITESNNTIDATADRDRADGCARWWSRTRGRLELHCQVNDPWFRQHGVRQCR